MNQSVSGDGSESKPKANTRELELLDVPANDPGALEQR